MSAGQHQDPRLIYMANQIARAFAAEGEERAVVATAEHLKKFWDPRMRARILTLFQAGQGEFLPVTRRALEQLSKS